MKKAKNNADQKMVGDLMSTDVVTVPDDMDLRNVAKVFIEEDISGAPVVDVLGNLVGVISVRDLVRYSISRDDELVMDSTFYEQARIEDHRIPKGFQIEDVNTGEVRDIMTPLVYSVTERASLRSVVQLMTKKHIHRVIVRRRKKPVGILSALDVLRELAKKPVR